MESLEQLNLRVMDMRFGTWNVRSLCRAGSLIAAAKEIAKNKLDFVGEQVRWDKGGTLPTGNYTRVV
jgi:hypothetical protein